MSDSILKQIHGAIGNLDPKEVRLQAEKPFLIGLLAGDEAGYQRLARFLLPDGLSDRKAQQAASHILRVEQPTDFERCNFGLVADYGPAPPNFYRLDQAVVRFVEAHEDLWITVARHFPAFRNAVVDKLVGKIARENAIFSIATALPNVAPFLGLPWAAGEFASDTAFLTLNQIRLAFLIAAASDSPVGYGEQKGQIASLITSAFGWRAVARELVGKIPLGGGIVPKAAIAFAGTYVVGIGLDRYQRVGKGLTAQEKRELYSRALKQGRQLVHEILHRRG
jgi:hypothetical protein